jgi:hypothetical protein
LFSHLRNKQHLLRQPGQESQLQSEEEVYSVVAVEVELISRQREAIVELAGEEEGVVNRSEEVLI